jgi:polysaccharide biosynthesis protein VpsQ
LLPPRLRRFYRIGLVAHSVLIVSIAAGAYAGVLPTKISLIPYYDTVMHFLLVGMFGFFLDGAFEHRSIVEVPFVPRVGPALALVLAAAEEYLQRLSPRRSSSWADFAANATGIFVCAFLARRISLSMIARRAAAPASPRPAAGEGSA